MKRFSFILLIAYLNNLNYVLSQDLHGPSECCVEYCFTTDYDRSQVKKFASKTSYEFIKPQNSESFLNIPNCEATKFWMLSRHGTRLPSAYDIELMKELPNLRDEIIKNYEMRRSKPDRGAICIQDLDLLRNWRWDYNITSSYEQFLTTQGWNEIKAISYLYRRAFPRLLNNIYDPQDFYFRYIKGQRTEASYKAFVEGLFGDRAYDHIKSPDNPEKDFLLKPYDECSEWKRNEKDLEENSNSEYKKFEALPMFQDMISDISTKMGFKYPLSLKQIDTLFDICRYEQAWFITKLSPWCSVFTKGQIDLLEYREDLKYYYKSGYGNEINKNIPCEVMKDLVTRLDMNSTQKTTIYFAHDTIIEMMLVALETYKDIDPLRADNFELSKRIRQWRTSKLIPFAANLVAVKYDCPNEPVRDKISLFINESPMHLPWCNTALCDFAKFKEQYKKYLDMNCEESFCSANSSQTIFTQNLFITILIVQIFIFFYKK